MSGTYLARQRHVLLDMHIPDWDERLLSRFDPHTFVNHCINAGADAVMIYCNSHVGLCYWPTTTGQMHTALRGRDIVAEQVQLLHDNNIAVCAYYSGPIFNNWAYTTHPDWRIAHATPGGMAHHGSRYGVVCPNNPDSMTFMLDQVDELAGAYPFDAFFFDMVFWPSVCACQSCRQRYRAEHDAEIPTVIDWFDPDWCRFQAARERWLADAFRQLRDRVKTHRAIPTFLNGATFKVDWWAGSSHELMRLNDLLGGDYGEPSLFPALSRFTPSVLQYMKPVSAYGGGDVMLLPDDEQRAHGFAAAAFGGQFMAIDAVAPDGGLHPPTYERIGEVFAGMEPYASHLGGEPVADVGVYLSQSGLVDFDDNGLGLDQAPDPVAADARRSPHSRAVDGAAHALKAAHLPFTVLSRADLGRLRDVSVLVLPNVLRMDGEELRAVRDYVDQGGRLYASGYTSLVTTDGTLHPDFQLADVLGCHFAGHEDGAVVYLKPAGPEAESWIAPVSYVAHGESDVNQPRFAAPSTALRVTAEPSAHVLATTTTPYLGGRGTRDDQDWISIHNSPPWDDTTRPAVVHHRFGRGEVVYSVADIETADQAPTSVAPAFFTAVIERLLGERRAFDAQAHPNLWMTAFDEPGRRTLRLCFLNHPEDFPTLPIPLVRFRVSPRPGRTFTGLSRAGSGEAVAFSLDGDGSLRAVLHDLEHFEMLLAEYE